MPPKRKTELDDPLANRPKAVQPVAPGTVAPPPPVHAVPTKAAPQGPERPPAPQPAVAAVPTASEAAAPAPAAGGTHPGIKLREANKAISVYVSPDDHKRLRRMAVDLDVSLQELCLRGLDLLLAQSRQEPMARFEGSTKTGR